MDAWLLHRGLDTLDVRFDRMCTTDEVLVTRLMDHQAVTVIRYPGLSDDPSYPLAKQQMSRFGFLIHISLADGEKAQRFINSCRYLQLATSFGGVHSSAERRMRWGDDVPEGAIRLSVGCEPVEELWSANDEALAAVS